jgi:hypothetical protein
MCSPVCPFGHECRLGQNQHRERRLRREFPERHTQADERRSSRRSSRRPLRRPAWWATTEAVPGTAAVRATGAPMTPLRALRAGRNGMSGSFTRCHLFDVFSSTEHAAWPVSVSSSTLGELPQDASVSLHRPGLGATWRSGLPPVSGDEGPARMSYSRGPWTNSHGIPGEAPESATPALPADFRAVARTPGDPAGSGGERREIVVMSE